MSIASIIDLLDKAPLMPVKRISALLNPGMKLSDLPTLREASYTLALSQGAFA